MAKERVVALFNNRIKTAQRDIQQYIVGGTAGGILDVTFRSAEVTPQIIIGISKLLKATGQEWALPFLTTRVINPIVKNQILSVRKKGPYNIDPRLNLPWWNRKSGHGSYIMTRGAGTEGKAGLALTFRFISSGQGTGTGANDGIVQNIVNGMRGDLYKRWIDHVWKQAPLFAQLLKQDLPKGTVSRDTNIAHDLLYTHGWQAIQKLEGHEVPIQLTGHLMVSDVAKQIRDNMNLDYGRNNRKVKIGKWRFNTYVSASIKENYPGSEDTDTKPLKNERVPEAIDQLVKKQKNWFGYQLWKMSGSPSPKSQVVDDAIKDIVRPYTKAGKPDFRFKVNQSLRNLKQFQNKKDSFPGKRSKNISPKFSTVTYKAPAAPGIRKEKGQGKQASTSQAADLARLKKYIQGRLPAEVRRNMGRPGLQNRTGRFSNSVQLLSLTEAKNSLMAKYTYLLSPYETFENKGKKRWPMAYNPKPLIAKSIRNLAQGRIEQKLTVRRV